MTTSPLFVGVSQIHLSSRQMNLISQRLINSLPEAYSQRLLAVLYRFIYIARVFAGYCAFVVNYAAGEAVIDNYIVRLVRRRCVKGGNNVIARKRNRVTRADSTDMRLIRRHR
jgi:hypothetical protein